MIGDTDRAFRLAFVSLYDRWDHDDLNLVAACIYLFSKEHISDSVAGMLTYGLAVSLCGRTQEGLAWFERASLRLRRDCHPADRDLRDLDALRLMLFSVYAAPNVTVDEAIECGHRVLTAIQQGLDLGIAGHRVRPNLARVHLLVDEPEDAEKVLNGDTTTDDATELLLVPGVRARVALRNGNLTEAMADAQQSLAAAAILDMPRHLGTLDALLATSGVLYERNDLIGAAATLERIQEIADHHPEAVTYQALVRVEAMRVAVARHGLDAGFRALGELESLIGGASRPALRFAIGALEARWRIEAHDFVRADTLIERCGRGPVSDLLRARLDMTRGRTNLARNRLASIDCTTLRDRLAAAVLAARLAIDDGNDHGDRYVERAVELAAPEGYVRVFIEEAPAITCRACAAAQRLGTAAGRRLATALDAPAARHCAPDPATLLTEREANILRFLPTRLSNHEIARETFVSVNTVKTHLRSIYRKLGASTWSEALQHAQLKGLL